MQDKTCLVTGATRGIGRAAAAALAEKGARVLGVGRDPGRCAAAEHEIAVETGNPRIRFLCADLSSQDEVRRLGSEILRNAPRLAVVIHNAGAMFRRRRETADGLEMTFALNHLAPFLLTHLLAERLRASAPARIVTVSSQAHIGAALDFDDLQRRRRYSRTGWPEYQRSKLANLLFTYELARRLAGSGVTANALHPGLVATGFARKAGLGLLRRLLLRLRSAGASRGAETVVFLAASPVVEGETGGYWIDRRRAESSPESRDQEAARRLWHASAELTGVPADWP